LCVLGHDPDVAHDAEELLCSLIGPPGLCGALTGPIASRIGAPPGTGSGAALWACAITKAESTPDSKNAVGKGRYFIWRSLEREGSITKRRLSLAASIAQCATGLPSRLGQFCWSPATAATPCRFFGHEDSEKYCLSPSPSTGCFESHTTSNFESRKAISSPFVM